MHVKCDDDWIDKRAGLPCQEPIKSQSVTSALSDNRIQKDRSADAGRSYDIEGQEELYSPTLITF